MQIFNIPDPIIFPFHVDFFTHIDTGTPYWGEWKFFILDILQLLFKYNIALQWEFMVMFFLKHELPLIIMNLWSLHGNSC